MTPSEAAEILRLHNIWRRWDFDEDQPAMIDPKTIGEAIDVVVSELSRNGESDRR